MTGYLIFCCVLCACSVVVVVLMLFANLWVMHAIDKLLKQVIQKDDCRSKFVDKLDKKRGNDNEYI